jgi:hypothetical protein
VEFLGDPEESWKPHQPWHTAEREHLKAPEAKIPQGRTSSPGTGDNSPPGEAQGRASTGRKLVATGSGRAGASACSAGP